MKTKGAGVSPWSTPAEMSKSSVSVSGIITVAYQVNFNR